MFTDFRPTVEYLYNPDGSIRTYRITRLMYHPDGVICGSNGTCPEDYSSMLASLPKIKSLIANGWLRLITAEEKNRLSSPSVWYQHKKTIEDSIKAP